MKKIISLLLMTMLLCSLLSVPSFADGTPSAAVPIVIPGAEDLTATMSVTGGTINPDGTVTWAVGENILTITTFDGENTQTYTVTVMYEPEETAEPETEASETTATPEVTAAPEETVAPEETKTPEETSAPEESAKPEEPEDFGPATLTELVIDGEKVDLTAETVIARAENAKDSVTFATDPEDATVFINGAHVLSGVEAEWPEGSTTLTVEVSKDGYETTSYEVTVEYAAPAADETDSTDTEKADDAKTVDTDADKTADTAETDKTGEESSAETAKAQEGPALAEFAIDGQDILAEFELDESATKDNAIVYSYDAAKKTENDLTVSGSVLNIAAKSGTVSTVTTRKGAVEKVNGAYPIRWEETDDVEVTLKDGDVTTTYKLHIANKLPAASAEILVNDVDVATAGSAKADKDSKYSLKVVVGAGQEANVTVNGAPAQDGIYTMSGTADKIVVTVFGGDNMLDKTYVVTVTANPETTAANGSNDENGLDENGNNDSDPDDETVDGNKTKTDETLKNQEESVESQTKD